MFNFKTLKCSYCGSVISNMPDAVISKLDGLTFQCENCNHSNVLMDAKLHKCHEHNATSIFNIIGNSLSA